MTLINGGVTRHRTYAMISSSFRCSEASPPPEVHFLVSYEDWTMSYWSYKDECKPVDEREAVAKPTASLGVSSSEEGILYPVHTRRLRGVAGRQERAWDHLGTMSEGKEIMKFVSCIFADSHFLSSHQLRRECRRLLWGVPVRWHVHTLGP